MNNQVVEKKVTSKSIIVDGRLHADFKMFCKGKNLKIGGMVEQLMQVLLDNPKEVQKLITKMNENDS